MIPLDEEDDGRLPLYWQTIRSTGWLVDIELRHVDSREAKNLVAVAELDPLTPFRWALTRFEVVDPKFDKGPHSTPWLGLWQAVIQACEANGIEELERHLLETPELSTTTLRAFGDEGVCNLRSYATRLYDRHPHAHALHFRGIGLEGLIVPPKTWKVR